MAIPLACVATCVTAHAAPPVGAGVAWAPIPELSDEFNTQHPSTRGDGIDYTKWYEDHPRWSGRPPSQFNPDNSWVEGGMLNLRATSLVDSMDEVANPDEDHWIDTAALVSRTQATYGSYYEAKVRVADISLATAFWFRMNQFSEIDVFENVGDPQLPNANFNRSSMRFTTIIYDVEPDIVVRDVVQMVDEEGDPLYSAENFITYGVWWKSPEEIIFYYNDLEVGNTHPGGLFNEGLHMIFDMEAFFWLGLPSIADLNDPTKNTAQVDWVRAYEAVELVAGDYDANGVVDEADYVRWRSDYGQTDGTLPADGNGDGVVDSADYTVWRDAYVTATATSVPEPGAVRLLVFAMVALSHSRVRWTSLSD